MIVQKATFPKHPATMHSPKGDRAPYIGKPKYKYQKFHIVISLNNITRVKTVQTVIYHEAVQAAIHGYVFGKNCTPNIIIYPTTKDLNDEVTLCGEGDFTEKMFARALDGRGCHYINTNRNENADLFFD